jgi:hypothetical protein
MPIVRRSSFFNRDRQVSDDGSSEMAMSQSVAQLQETAKANVPRQTAGPTHAIAKNTGDIGGLQINRRSSWEERLGTSSRDPRKEQILSDQPTRLQPMPVKATNTRGEERRPTIETQAAGASVRPIVRVTIGRIEVKAVMQNSAPTMPATSVRPQPTSLAEHLKERNKERR